MSEPTDPEPVEGLNGCPARHSKGVFCIAPKGHKADGKGAFDFHAAYSIESGRLLIWTDTSEGEPRRRARQKADHEQSFRFPPIRGSVAQCGSTMTPPGEQLYQCEKVEGHEPNHVAHRADNSMVVWA
jgi:hypothetical protein